MQLLQASPEPSTAGILEPGISELSRDAAFQGSGCNWSIPGKGRNVFHDTTVQLHRGSGDSSDSGQIHGTGHTQHPNPVKSDVLEHPQPPWQLQGTGTILLCGAPQNPDSCVPFPFQALPAATNSLSHQSKCTWCFPNPAPKLSREYFISFPPPSSQPCSQVPALTQISCDSTRVSTSSLPGFLE